MSAVQYRCMTDLAALVTSLNLQGTPGVTGDIGSNVYVQLIPEQLAVQTPCVLVTTIGEAEEEGPSTFTDDCVIYPVRIIVVDQSSTNYQARLGDYLNWRYTIATAVRGKTVYPLLPTTPECYEMRLRDQPVFDGRLDRARFVQSGFVVRCKTYVRRLKD